MVFISLEDVISASSSTCAGNCSTKQSVSPKATIRVVATPGSAAKQKDTPHALFSSQRTPPSLVYFVLYVSGSAMRQTWVLSKTSDDHAQLRKSLRQVGSSCRDPACCGPVHRLSRSISTRRLWGSVTTDKQYDQCNAFQTYVNDLIQTVLGHDTRCQTMERTRHLLEDFLDIAFQRANAIDRVLYYKNPASPQAVVSPESCRADHDHGNTRDDSSECPICCGDLADDKTLRLLCGHSYHAECVLVWFNIQNTCPVCRQQLNNRAVWK